MSEVRAVQDKNVWEQFVLSRQANTFLHSWNWGEFNERQGSKTWRLGIFENGDLVGAALVVEVKARRGKFLFVPHGPIVRTGKQELRTQEYGSALEVLVDYLKLLARGEGCRFVRVGPLLERNDRNEKLFADLGFRRAPIHMHAETVWLLDIAPNEEQLLSGMRKACRYSIRKAEKEGVLVTKGATTDDLERFKEVYRETAERQHFTAYSGAYLENELRAFAHDNQALVFLARYKGEVLAGALVVFYGEAAFYHQGASSSKYSQIPAAHLLQWEVIKEAKKRGCALYNFWGVVEEDEGSTHPWQGLTFFKKGFGGYSEAYVPAQDLPLKLTYWVTYVIEKWRKARRNL